MLTGDLVRVQQKGKTLVPSFVNPQHKRVQETARDLFNLLMRALERQATRQDIDQDIDWSVADRRDHKMVRGMAKVGLDRATFETQSDIEPAMVREEVFTQAAQMGPLALEDDPLGRPTAQSVYEVVSERLDVSVSELNAALYGDLKSAQKIIELKVESPEWLVNRYNVALVQALLLKSESLSLRLKSPEPARLKQLLRQMKFHQLIHHAHLVDDVLHIELDGPTSLFKQSTRYGMQLAIFFPAVLLQTGEWELEATVRWTRRRLRKTLKLDQSCGLISHYQDRGAYKTREQQWFEERFQALDTDWVLEPGTLPIDLAGRAVLLPDYVLRKGEWTIQLEILGFWRKETLEKRLRLLKKYGPPNWLVAISRKRGTSKQKQVPLDGPILEFAEILSPKKVIQWAEALYSAEGS